MSNILLMAGMFSGPWSNDIIVNMTDVTVNNTRSGVDCLSNMKVDQDGDIYESDNTGAYGASAQTWLDAGSSSAVWVARTVTLGTLTTDAGTGRLQCNVDREFGVTDPPGAASKQANITLKFYDAASGGNLLFTTGDNFLIALSN